MLNYCSLYFYLIKNVEDIVVFRLNVFIFMSFSIAKQEMRKSQDNQQIKKKQFKDRKTLI